MNSSSVLFSSDGPGASVSTDSVALSGGKKVSVTRVELLVGGRFEVADVRLPAAA
jgi:hypothetical protein